MILFTHCWQALNINRTVAFLLLLLNLGCAAENHQIPENNDVIKKEKPIVTNFPFEIDFQIERIDDQFYLATTIDFLKGNYIVSPYSQDSVYGRLDISIMENENLMVDNTLLEIPRTFEEYDPIIKQAVRFVRGKTTYKQKIKATVQDDFEVSGVVWFVFEPECKPYEVEFIISYQSEEMTVKKTNTTIDYKTYKGK